MKYGGYFEGGRPSPLARLALDILKRYKAAESMRPLPPRCRYRPTCSAYAREAIERYGFLRGVALAYRRCRRCVAGSVGGNDPVP